MSQKWVYLFDEVHQAEVYKGNDWEKVRGLLGGKGANLAEMTRMNIPVPPGFTITTEACNTYLNSKGSLPQGMWAQVQAAVMAQVPAETVFAQGVGKESLINWEHPV